MNITDSRGRLEGVYPPHGLKIKCFSVTTAQEAHTTSFMPEFWPHPSTCTVAVGDFPGKSRVCLFSSRAMVRIILPVNQGLHALNRLVRC